MWIASARARRGHSAVGGTERRQGHVAHHEDEIARRTETAYLTKLASRRTRTGRHVSRVFGRKTCQYRLAAHSGAEEAVRNTGERIHNSSGGEGNPNSWDDDEEAEGNGFNGDGGKKPDPQPAARTIIRGNKGLSLEGQRMGRPPKLVIMARSAPVEST